MYMLRKQLKKLQNHRMSQPLAAVTSSWPTNFKEVFGDKFHVSAEKLSYFLRKFEKLVCCHQCEDWYHWG